MNLRLFDFSPFYPYSLYPRLRAVLPLLDGNINARNCSNEPLNTYTPFPSSVSVRPLGCLYTVPTVGAEDI